MAKCKCLYLLASKINISLAFCCGLNSSSQIALGKHSFGKTSTVCATAIANKNHKRYKHGVFLANQSHISSALTVVNSNICSTPIRNIVAMFWWACVSSFEAKSLATVCLYLMCSKDCPGNHDNVCRRFPNYLGFPETIPPPRDLSGDCFLDKYCNTFLPYFVAALSMY